VIIYRGPSLIDSKPIVCVAVFPKGESKGKSVAIVAHGTGKRYI
jgi:hypothetical protein